MDFDGVNSVVCDAEENDWLDVSYSERNYVEEPKRQKSRPHFKFKWNKSLKIAAIAVLCAAVLAALLFADGQFAKDVFKTAKAAFSSTLFDSVQPQPVTATVAIPANADLVDVVDGVATFNGGRAALSFTDGVVAEVGENSVTVSLDEETCIVYGNLSEIYVAAGDAVKANSLLAKYDGTFTACVTVNGVAVANVIASDENLTWNV